MKLALLALAVLAASAEATGHFGCVDGAGKNVDYYRGFKLPKMEDGTADEKAGFAFAYLGPDGVLTDDKYGLEKENEALYQTLKPLYDNGKKAEKSSTIHFILYNDEGPFKDAKETIEGKKTSAGAHQKGVLAYDSKIKQGFWLIHSVPRWPFLPSNGVWGYTDHEANYGQSFLCLTLDAANIAKVVGQLKLSNPLVHESANPTKDADLAAVIEFKRTAEEKKPQRKVVELSTVGGHKVTSFSKNVAADSHMYDDMVHPHYKTPFQCETWQRSKKLPSVCDKVVNIKKVKIHDREFTETKDHSKWCYSAKEGGKHVSCIGGINREDTQRKRGGGTVCTTDAKVYAVMSKFGAALEKCGKEEALQSNKF